MKTGTVQCAPGRIRTCATTPPAAPPRSPLIEDTAGERLAAGVSRSEFRDLERLAEERRLAVFDQRSLLDFAAVGVTKLIWRNSLVEDWHSVRHRRIGQAEMMRANAATTRLVRDALQRHAPDDPVGIFGAVAAVIADGSRELPDGRHLRQLAPSKADYGLFHDEVTAVCREWQVRAVRHGLRAVLLALACEAGRGSSRRWWLGPDWAAVVAEFVARLEDPERWDDATHAAWVRPVDLPEPGRLGELLSRGPDLLGPAWADYCLRAGIGAIIPRWWEEPPLPRRPGEVRGDG
jgi:hypothetical protein